MTEKEWIDKKLKFIEKYKVAENAAAGSEYDANANVTAKNVATMQSEIVKDDMIKINRAITEKYLKDIYGDDLVESFKKDLAHHNIYSHDETGLAPYTYGPHEKINVKYKNKESIYTFEELYKIVCEDEHLLDEEKGVWGKYPNDMFILDRYGWTKVERLIKKKRHRDMVKIKIASGDELIVTDNHPLIISDYVENTVPAVDGFGHKQFIVKHENIESDWYVIDNIAKLEEKQLVGYDYIYDITTESHSFICNNIWAHNCVAVSLYPFLLNGLKDLGGSSLPPKHADSYIGGMINLIFLLAGQYLGACAVPEFLPYFDHFLRVDFGDDYIDHLDESVVMYGKRKETLRDRIEDWFQQFVYSINQPAGSRNYQSPFVNISYYDKGYFESIFNGFVFPDGDEPKWETTKELQKMFIKWFNAERTKTILTFPVETFNAIYFKKETLAKLKDKNSELSKIRDSAVEELYTKYNNDHLNTISYDQFKEILKNNEALRDDLKKLISEKISLKSNDLEATVRTVYEENPVYVDEESADLISTAWSKGHSFFVYTSDSADALSSCCLYYKTKVLVKEKLDSKTECEEIRDLYNKYKDKVIYTLCDGEWAKAKLIKLPYRQIYTVRCKNKHNEVIELSVSDNHINITERGNIYTTELCVGDKLKYSENIESKEFEYIPVIEIVEKDKTDDDGIYCFEMENQDEPYFTLPNGIITHNCRLKNAIEENIFSYTLGAGGIQTGSKKVITLNLNRIVQDWYKNEKDSMSLNEYVTTIVKRVHKYLTAWNHWLWDLYNSNLLTVYKAGFISLDKQYLTVGVNGFLEGAEFLSNTDTKYHGLKIQPDNELYKQYAKDILETIKQVNKEDRTEHTKFNTEMVPAENAGAKLYNWDKRDGYWVPEVRNLYNSYFYPVEDASYDVLTKMKLHGNDFVGCLDGR